MAYTTLLLGQVLMVVLVMVLGQWAASHSVREAAGAGDLTPSF